MRCLSNNLNCNEPFYKQNCPKACHFCQSELTEIQTRSIPSSHTNCIPVPRIDITPIGPNCGLKFCTTTDFIIEINNLANELIQGIENKLHESNSKIGSSTSPAMVSQLLNFFTPETRATSDLDHQTLANLSDLSMNLNASRIQLLMDITNITNV